jgi:hypothetical protein
MKNAFDWAGGSSFATLPNNHYFQTKRFKAWRIACRERWDETPSWPVYRDNVRPEPKRGRTKKEKVLISLMSQKEKDFNRKMEALARAAMQDPKPDNFNCHIATQAESDRTHSIGRAV